jgi:hypothetical protein
MENALVISATKGTAWNSTACKNGLSQQHQNGEFANKNGAKKMGSEIGYQILETIHFWVN